MRATSDRGQIFIMLAVTLPILLLFVALALDVGVGYITKAKLSKAVDAACLTGMKNLAQGQPSARALALHVFNANYGANPPIPTITFPTDAYNDQQVSVTATANVNTLFARSVFPTWQVKSAAVATRGKLVMSLILDRSGSMDNAHDKGGAALQVAVPNFIDDFSDTNDEVAMISFASNATVDFPISYTFTKQITNMVAALKFTGATFGTGAGSNLNPDSAVGPPLSLALQQNDKVIPQPGQNVTKVVVYFTDGSMNTIQDTFNCPTAKLVNYGGYDDNSAPHFFDPANGNDWGAVSSSGNSKGALPYDSTPHYCKDATGKYVTTFYSQGDKKQEAFLQSNITADAKYRALQTATALRTETPVPTYIYVIGLGSGVTSATQAFLGQIANDPAYPATYQAKQPAGLFLYVPNCPSTTCTNDLNIAFQTIAAKILLRLTQ